MGSVSEYRYLQQALGLSGNNMYSLADLRSQYYEWIMNNPPSTTVTVDNISDATPLVKNVMKLSSGLEIRSAVGANGAITAQTAPVPPNSLSVPGVLQLSVLVDIVNTLNGTNTQLKDLITKMKTMGLLKD